MAAVVTTLAACESDLTVPNTDRPDVKRAFATPEGIEAIIRGGFSQVFGATYDWPGATGSIIPAMQVFALESFGSVANYGMNTRASLPRTISGIDNNLGNPQAAENLRDFQQLSLRGRTVANAVNALDALIAKGGTLNGNDATARKSNNARARSFGFFVVALANGQMALAYDSVGVLLPAMPSDEIPALAGYQSAMGTALAQLDSAIKIATDAQTGGYAFTIPPEWMPVAGGVNYVQMLHSLKARFRAGVARNPTQRAAVDWNAVVNDAALGITTDVTLNLQASAGYAYDWLFGAMGYEGWHGMSPYIIGMADTTGAYDAWIATPRGDRVQFLIRTPDRRFPSGETRAAQQTNSPPANVDLPSIYFRNRAAGQDTPGEAWGNSMYDHVRFRSYRQNSQVGQWVWMDKTEIDMLRAEGLMRLGRDAEAVPLINLTRVANGLAPFTAGSTQNTTAPLQGGANSCVPRVPLGTGAPACGTMFEAMKWEKRLETLFTGYGQWYQDSRGWGDLPLGTIVMWPVPYQEMQAREKEFYNGPPKGKELDPEWRATVSNYGFGVGSR